MSNYFSDLADRKGTFLVLTAINFALTFGFYKLLNFWFIPSHTIKSGGFLLTILFPALFFTLLLFVTEYKLELDSYLLSSLFLIICSVATVIIIICAIYSSRLCNSRRYQSLIKVETGNFSEDIASINSSDVAIVDVDTARAVGNRVMGSLSNLSSQFDANNEYNLVIINGTKYRISPLEYGGFFKWKNNEFTGVPGYIKVNALTQKPEYVEVEGMKYVPSACFSYKLERHLKKQYPGYFFDKSHFEIDDEGNPYYVTGVITKNICFGGNTINQVVITNPCNGASEIYAIDEIPSWVDHAFSLSYLMEKAEDYYMYTNGFWNTYFSKTNVKKLSYSFRDDEPVNQGYNSFIANNDVCFFTGVTSDGKDESIFGFILANTRNGKIKFYECAGGDELSAQEAAEGLVQNMSYKSTYPTIINIDGEETYLMTLKDNGGLIKAYALANVIDATIVTQAESLDNAMKLYQKKLNKPIDEETTLSFKKAIVEKYSCEIEGTTYYFYSFADDTNLYKSSILNNQKQITFEKGTQVEVFFEEPVDGICDVINIK